MIQRRPLTFKEALARAEDMCNRAERCTDEVRRKLLRLGVSAADTEAVIERLTAARYIDDARFARLYARDRVEYAGWGRRKIAAALAVRRIPRQAINEALDALDQEIYLARLRDIVARRRRSLPDADTYEGRTRIFRHAASRGFEPQLIIDAINSLPSE